ncbi:MAG: hypothetical protein ABI321_19325 [Polyangia bacterium]
MSYDVDVIVAGGGPAGSSTMNYVHAFHSSSAAATAVVCEYRDPP